MTRKLGITINRPVRVDRDNGIPWLVDEDCCLGSVDEEIAEEVAACVNFAPRLAHALRAVLDGGRAALYEGEDLLKEWKAAQVGTGSVLAS